jgi:peptide/nickel transport system substrate-binding protein
MILTRNQPTPSCQRKLASTPVSKQVSSSFFVKKEPKKLLSFSSRVLKPASPTATHRHASASRHPRLAFTLLLLLLTNPAFADQKANCGTIVLPTGIGVARSADLTSFNPLFVNSIYNQEASNLLFQELIWVNRYGQIDWARSVASSVTSPDNGTTYIVTLRPWHWSDGVPVTSADVKYALSLIDQLGDTWVGLGSGGMPGIIKSFTILDDTHFKIVLTHQSNETWFIYNGLSSLVPMPAHIWGKYSIDQIWQGQSSPDFFKVVDGPMKLATLNPGQDAVFVPNPAYDGPHMHFLRLVLKFLDRNGTDLEDYEAGELDMINQGTITYKGEQNLPNTYKVPLPPNLSFYTVILNMRNPKSAFFRDVKVRQAMQDSMDQNSMIYLVWRGQGVPVYGPVPPSPPLYSSPEMKAGTYPVGYNVAKARALLLSDGYKPGPDGIMVKNGVRLSFNYLLTDGGERYAEYFQQAFAKIGIEMKVHVIEFNQMLSIMGNSPNNWEAGYLGQDLSPYPTGESLLETGAFENFGGYSDPTMDKLINESVNNQGIQGLYAYEDYAISQQPMIFAGGATVTLLVNKRLHGAADFIDTLGQFSPDQLYCTPGTAK